MTSIFLQTYDSCADGERGKMLLATTVASMATIPGNSTIIYWAFNTWQQFLVHKHEIIVKFTMLPIVAGSAIALIFQFIELSPFPKHLLPRPAPAPPDPHR